jgi:hypothetical protein
LAYLTWTSPPLQVDDRKLNERPKLVNGTGTLAGRMWVGPAENEAQVVRNSPVNRLKDATRQLI